MSNYNHETFAKLHKINQGVPAELIEEAIKWLSNMGSQADGFAEALNLGHFDKITSSPNAPKGGIQVWCRLDSGFVNGPGRTPNHELWRNGDGTFSIKNDLSYG